MDGINFPWLFKNIFEQQEEEEPEELPTTAYDEYQSHMAEMPQYERPGFGRRLLAGLIGGLQGIKDPRQGFETVEELNTGGYKRGLADWQIRAKALEQAAQAERERRNLLRQERDTASAMRSREDLGKHRDLRRGQIDKQIENTEEERIRQDEDRDRGIDLREQEAIDRAEGRAAAQRNASRRTGLYAQDVNDRIKKRGGAKPTTPKQLNDAKKLAIQQVAESDPELAAAYDKKKGMFNSKKINPSRMAEIEEKVRLRTDDILKNGATQAPGMMSVEEFAEWNKRRAANLKKKSLAAPAGFEEVEEEEEYDDEDY